MKKVSVLKDLNEVRAAIRETIATVTSNDQEIQNLFDIISIDPEKYGKYIDLLQSKYGVDFYDYYKDEDYIQSASLNDIKSKSDFLSWDNYVRYAKKIFGMRRIQQPHHIDKQASYEQVKQIGDVLGFKTQLREYQGVGNYAAFDLVDTIIVPSKVDVNTLTHEIGHFFDHNVSGDYQGLAKTITYASSPYGIGQSNEVFAENFLHYFIAPGLLREKLPEVYNELDKRIPTAFKNTILSYL